MFLGVLGRGAGGTDRRKATRARRSSSAIPLNTYRVDGDQPIPVGPAAQPDGR